MAKVLRANKFQGGGIEQRIPIPVIVEKNATSVSKLMIPLAITTATQFVILSCATPSAEIKIGSIAFIDGSVLSYQGLNQGEKTVIDSIKSDFVEADQSGGVLGIDPSGKANNQYQSMSDIIASNLSFASKENIKPEDLGINNDGLNVFSLKIGEKDKPVIVYNYEANVEGVDNPAMFSFFFSKNDKGEWVQAAMVDDKNDPYGYLVDADGISLSGMLIPQGEDQKNNNFITFITEGGKTYIVELDKDGNRLAKGEFPFNNGLFELKKGDGQSTENTKNISFKVGSSATATPLSTGSEPPTPPTAEPAIPTPEKVVIENVPTDLKQTIEGNVTYAINRLGEKIEIARDGKTAEWLVISFAPNMESSATSVIPTYDDGPQTVVMLAKLNAHPFPEGTKACEQGDIKTKNVLNLYEELVWDNSQKDASAITLGFFRVNYKDKVLIGKVVEWLTNKGIIYISLVETEKSFTHIKAGSVLPIGFGKGEVPVDAVQPKGKIVWGTAENLALSDWVDNGCPQSNAQDYFFVLGGSK